MKAIFSFLRRIARVHDISPVVVGGAAVFDAVHDTNEMGSRFDRVPIPRWGFNEDFATLLASLEASMPSGDCRNFGGRGEDHHHKP
ncbi:TniB family NTP-binding protein [Pseudorhodobacter sp.]|uniref:TniB family NTP-binding protein n=1 Tax=Pseudorhodobacter sp. TaxID=1934400 RepID=UPI003463C0A1